MEMRHIQIVGNFEGWDNTSQSADVYVGNIDAEIESDLAEGDFELTSEW